MPPGMSRHTLRSSASPRTDSFALQKRDFTLRGRAAWAHDSTTIARISACSKRCPAPSVRGQTAAAQAQDAALTTASDELKWLNGWSPPPLRGNSQLTNILAAGRRALRVVTSAYGPAGRGRFREFRGLILGKNDRRPFVPSRRQERYPLDVHAAAAGPPPAPSRYGGLQFTGLS